MLLIHLFLEETVVLFFKFSKHGLLIFNPLFRSGGYQLGGPILCSYEDVQNSTSLNFAIITNQPG